MQPAGRRAASPELREGSSLWTKPASASIKRDCSGCKVISCSCVAGSMRKGGCRNCVSRIAEVPRQQGAKVWELRTATRLTRTLGAAGKSTGGSRLAGLALWLV